MVCACSTSLSLTLSKVRPLTVPGDHRWKMGAGAAILIVVLSPLWVELSEPGVTIWNVVLALILVGLAVGTFFLQRHLIEHIGEIGEARFDTRNKSEREN